MKYDDFAKNQYNDIDNLSGLLKSYFKISTSTTLKLHSMV